MKLLWRSGRRRGKADGKEKEKDIRESRKPWSGITAQKVSIVAVLFLVMYALGALTAKKAESVGVSALLHEKVKTGDWVLARKESRRQEMRVQRN